MAKFQYIAVNQQNKTLKGNIEAADETAARAELNNIGLSIIEINKSETNQETKSPEQIIYHFTAQDRSGKKVIGTIKGQDEVTVFRRLNEEYGFQVLALETESSGVKTPLDINTIQNQAGKISMEDAEIANQNEGQQQRKRPIEIEVESIINQIQENLQTLKGKLKPEAEKNIQDQINKLLLIKSSTNEEYIRESCKKILESLHNEDNFKTEEEHSDLRNKMALESQKLLFKIKRNENQSIKNISSSIFSKIKSLRSNNKKTSFISKFTGDALNKIANLFEVSPEEAQIKQKISLIQSQIWDYYKLWFKSSKENKKEVIKSINNLKKEKNKEKESLKKLKQHIKVEKFTKSESVTHHQSTSALISINTFTGWLLAFYLIYYTIGFLITNNTALNISTNWNFNIFQIPFLKQFIFITFILHAATSTKIIFFKFNTISSFAITIISAILILFSIINL